MIGVDAPLEAQLLIIMAYLIIILQFIVRWKSIGVRGTKGRLAVGLLIGIFTLRIFSEVARMLGVYDQVQAVAYWALVVIAWSFVIWNHAGTIADALSVGNERRPR
jgi:hypothetical protein